MTKILILSDGIPPYIMGGMQRHTLNLVKSLVESGVYVKLIHCVNEGDDDVSNEEVNNLIFQKEEVDGFDSNVVQFPKPGKIPGHYIRRSYSYSKSVYNLIEAEVDDYDFVYIKGFSGWKLLEEKKNFKPKMGVNFHGYEMFQPPIDFKSRIKNQILIPPVRKNMTKADFVFSYGAGITDLLKSIEVTEDKIISINGAVDKSWLETNPKIELHTPVRLLFVGRFERRKGIQELNSVLPKFLDDSSFEMSFVGPIPEESKIKHPKVTYFGAVSDVVKIQKICSEHDVLLAPSYSEGMPNVIMEAMSCGLAILTTDVGATSLLVDDSNGWLMPQMDEGTFQSTLMDLKSCSPEKILMKKEKSKLKLSDQFSWKYVAQKHLEFFNSL